MRSQKSEVRDVSGDAKGRDAALDMALAQIEKQHGKGSIMRLGDRGNIGVETVSTGSLALDVALGVGGLPRGRIVEIYGPEGSGKTSLSLHVIAEAQKAGGLVAFIDAEHALDPSYARALGVDIDNLLVSQPDTGEQALEITDTLVRSGAMDVIAIDSVAALVPRAEIEGEMGDTHVGLQARLMSQALRKLAGSVNRTKTILVFINQIREKVGVMFGCFSYSTRVTLADGSQEQIGKIVNQKMPVEVLSYNFETGRVEPRKVVNWYRNGKADHFLQFTALRPGGNGKAQFAATPNHLIRTPHGWREAKDLKPGDHVLQAVEERLSEFQWDVVRGALMGDGALSKTRRPHLTDAGIRFRMGHGEDERAYLDWKASLLGNIPMSRSVDEKGSAYADLTPLVEFAPMRRDVYREGSRKTFDWDYLKRLTPLSLAIWYQDDGHLDASSEAATSARIRISVGAMTPETRTRLVTYLRDTWNVDVRLSSARGKANVVFSEEAAEEFQSLIAPFVHPSMEDKLLPQFRDRFSVEPVFEKPRYELLAYPIVDVHRKPPSRSMQRFDIEVEGNHNYLVDGVMVHNSPETTPGGRALKFYASVRLDVRRIDSLKNGAEIVGSRVRVKVLKNKCVAAGTQVFDPATGLTRRVEEIVEDDADARVWAVDKRGRFHVKPVTARFVKGEQDVMALRLGGGTSVTVTPDHKILTETGWKEAGTIAVGERVARPRIIGGFGDVEPVPPDHARLLGYLIGDGYVGGKPPVAFINSSDEVHEDAARIATTLGCKVERKSDGLYATFSHCLGEKNPVLEFAERAGIWGHSASEKKLSSELFASDVSSDVIANLLFGIWESGGYIRRDRTGGIRVGFTTTSEQLAWQIHWLLLRWGIISSVSRKEPRGHRSYLLGHPQGSLRRFHVGINGLDNVLRFTDAVPTWGPRGKRLVGEIARSEPGTRRGSRALYLPEDATKPVLGHLEHLGVTAKVAASMLGLDAADAEGGWARVLGRRRLRRDGVTALAETLDSPFLREVLDDQLFFERVIATESRGRMPTYDLEVEDLHNFVADGIVVHNCAAPFRTAEFDIQYGYGISKEGSLLDVAIEHGFVRKSGAWFIYGDDQLGQGRENAKAFLAENPDIATEIELKIKEKLGLLGEDEADTGGSPTE